MVGTVFPSKTVVPAPPATAPRYSLLGVADLVNDGPAEAAEDSRPVRWQFGVEWVPEQVNQGSVVQYDNCGHTAALDDEHDIPSLVRADPFLVYAEDHCSTFGFEAHDFGGRATRQLLATQSFQVAREFEAGALAQASSNDNVYLSKAPTVVGSPAAQAAHLALGDIEMALAEHFGGQRSMIHASPALLTMLVENGVLNMAGNKWLTPMGNVVVADAGYKGTKPAGSGSTNQFLYGTSMVQYRLTSIDLLPGTFESAMAQATDRSINRVVIYAQRVVLLQFEPGEFDADQADAYDGVFAAETNVPAFTL